MFLPFVNLDMIFSFFGSSWKYDKSGGAFVCTYTCGQNIATLELACSWKWFIM